MLIFYPTRLINLEVPVHVRSMKSSNVELGQYLNGRLFKCSLSTVIINLKVGYIWFDVLYWLLALSCYRVNIWRCWLGVHGTCDVNYPWHRLQNMSSRVEILIDLSMRFLVGQQDEKTGFMRYHTQPCSVFGQQVNYRRYQFLNRQKKTVCQNS